MLLRLISVLGLVLLLGTAWLLSLTQHKADLDPRSFTLATYALCGFANFASIAIQIGGIGALAPERRTDLAQLGLRSMIAGLIACYLSAAVVGSIL